MGKQLTKEQREQREKRNFKKKIWSVFTGAGFNYIATNNRELFIGHRKVEIDAMYVYKNIWVLCEDTIRNTNIRDHIRTKNEATHEIRENLEEYRKALVKIFPEKADVLQAFDINRIKLFSLYFSKEEILIDENDKKLFSDLVFVTPQTLNYFQWIVGCIKRSAINEIFRFLEVKRADIGAATSSGMSNEITAPIVYPKSFTGLKNDVRVVSFMMSASDLLDTCYVMRKDNWSESIWLYQRLIDKNKIKKIREFLFNERVSFYNNIIVGLPDGVRFKDSAGNYKNISDISEFNDDYKLVLPREINSICVIDGQHRIFAHYESGKESDQESRIDNLRKELHLLVTGLVFPEKMGKEERARIQSKIFLDINSNAKPVPPNVLLQIKRIQNPIADESLAQNVIERLNSKGVFQGLLQISPLDGGRIKTASIVRFALRYLVTTSPAEGRQSLFTHWDGDKEGLLNLDDEAIDNYVEYCDSVIRIYFGAIKNNLAEQWNDKDSKLLSVIAINGFIIAFNRQLSINGVRDFEFYDNLFNEWECDFSKEGFHYTSSQYKKFSTQILKEVFKIDDNTLLGV